MGFVKKPDYNSLRFWLIKSLSVWSILLLVPILCVITIVVKMYIDALLADEIEEYADRVASVISDQVLRVSEDPLNDETIERLQLILNSLSWIDEPEDEKEKSRSPERAVLKTLSGQVLVESPGSPSGFFDAVPVTPGFYDTENTRFYTQILLEDRMVLQFAADVREASIILAEIMSAILLGVLLLVPAVALAVLYLARSMQAHFSDFSHEIEARSVENLSPLDPTNAFTEVRPAIQSVNGLMARLKHALSQEREFSANVAHELRTPLAVILAQSQRMKKVETREECQTKALEIERSTKRATHLIERLLQLSRVERKIGRAEADADLTVILTLLVSDFNRHPDYENRVVAHLSDNQVLCKVDGDAFGIIVSNLLENALRYSPAGSRVTVEQTGNGDISIQNDCEVVALKPSKEIRSRSAKGLGLGISISTMLAEQSGLKLTFSSPIPGDHQGVEARIVVH